MTSPAVYLDHNATTAPLPVVIAAMTDAMARAWANPSSTHAPGQAARRLLADARARVAHALDAQPAEVVFTSGATEANHAAILGTLRAFAGGARRRLVVSAIEHPGLLSLADRLAADGVPVARIGVDRAGRLDLAQARVLIAEDVALVSVMAANNETGVCLPIAELAALARAAGAWLHVDATQVIGKAAFSFARSGADLVSVSAHKVHGPKGVGALLVRKGRALPPMIAGRQERQRRGGTENLPGIAGFAAACDALSASAADDITRMQRLRDRFERELATRVAGTVVLGGTAPRIANTCCVRFGTLPSDLVLDRLERAGVIAASGAACSAGGMQPSHVLLAMGESPAAARAGIRFSLGRETTESDLDRALAAIEATLAPLVAANEPVATPSLESAE